MRAFELSGLSIEERHLIYKDLRKNKIGSTQNIDWFTGYIF